MPTMTMVDTLILDAFQGVHDFSSDTLRVALTNTAPAASDTVFAPGSSHPPPAAANGYTTQAVTVSDSSQSSGTYKLTITDPTFTASGGQIGPFPLCYSIQ